jgi:hypothetical protein
MFICKKSMEKPENAQMLRTWAIATRFENYTHPFPVAWIADPHGEAIFSNLLPTPTWVRIT